MLWFIVLTFECEKWFGEILVFGKLPSIAVNGFYDHDILKSGYKKLVKYRISLYKWQPKTHLSNDPHKAMNRSVLLA